MRFLIFVLTTLCCASAVGIAAEHPNVLFVAVDDLRPELACYGKSHIVSPNIDALAKRGVLFERSYCMVPTCGASRASLMTGIRPTRNRFKNYLAWAEKDAPGITTLNTHFRNNAYRTIGLGKIFHHKTDSDVGWSEPPWRPKTSDWHDEEARKRDIAEHKAKYPQRSKIRGKPYEWSDDPDETYRDGEVATKAIESLRSLAKQSDPFFLAVGFYKPHLPFCAPKKYWDLYDSEKISLPSNYHAPQEAPAIALHTSGETRSYATVPPKGPLPEELARKLIHGYYACVSFTDAQIGRVVDELDELGLANNTIVVLWGDHGWQLGEHGMWNKHSCFETSMHAPLLISAPGLASNVRRVNKLVEFVDIYPTLCELTGLESPAHLQGDSLVPLIRDLNAPWKQFAVGRYKTGDTIRSESHRYSEYTDGPITDATSQRTGRMLYDHNADPAENQNVAELPDNATVVQELAGRLRSIVPASSSAE